MTQKEAAALLTQLQFHYSVLSKHKYYVSEDTTEALSMAVWALQEKEQDNSGKRKAHWQWFDEENGTPFDGYDRDWGWECSNCGYILPDDFDYPDCIPTYRYCMNCGAEMISEG